MSERPWRTVFYAHDLERLILDEDAELVWPSPNMKGDHVRVMGATGELCGYADPNVAAGVAKRLGLTIYGQDGKPVPA